MGIAFTSNEGGKSLEAYYKKSEIAELLNIKETKVYHLVKEGLIVTAPNPFNARKENVYYKEQVDQLAEIARKYDGYLTTGEVAKSLDITPAQVRRIIEQNNVEYAEIENSHLGKKKRIIISAENVERIKAYAEKIRQSPRYSKHTYYNKNYNIAESQLFLDNKQQGVRVHYFEDKNDWGFTVQGQFMPYETAVNLFQLKPAYSINQKQEYSPYSTEFTISVPSQLPLLDFFYQQRGIENMVIIERDEHTIKFNVSTAVVTFNDEMSRDITSQLLKDCVTAGEVDVIGEEIFLNGSTRRLNTTIDTVLYNKLFAEATALNTDMNRVLEQILTEHYNKKEES